MNLTSKDVGQSLVVLVAFFTSVFLGIESCGAATPTNDDFSAATEIVSSSSLAQTNLIAGTTVGATVEPGENNNSNLAAYNQRGTIWWKWTCPAPGDVEFTAYSQSASLMGGAFTGSTVSSLTTFSPVMSDVFWHPDFTFGAGGAFFIGEAGVTYFFAVMPNPNTTEPAGEVQGMLIFRPTPTPPPGIAPTNDLFANAIVLVGTNLTVQGDNTGASTEPGENVGPGFVILTATVWYSWTAPTNGVVYFSGGFTNSDYWFSLGTYRGTDLNALTVPPATGDAGFVVEPGDTFKLQIGSARDNYWGRGGQAGPFALNIRMNVRTPASSNDRFADRFDITLPTYHFDGSIYGATNEPGEPLPSASTRQTLWWRFVAPENGLMRIVPSGPFVIRVAAYEGSELGSLTALSTPDGNRFPVQGGHEYAIQAASDYVPTGGFSIDTLFRSSSNDMFAGSVRLEGTDVIAEGDPVFATFEPNEPNPGSTNTIWFSWAAPATGRVWFWPGPYSVYTGSSLEQLSQVGLVSAGGNSQWCFLAEEGMVYHFQYVGGEQGFRLQFEPFVPAPNDQFANALVFWGTMWSDRRSVLGATMELGEPAHLGDGVATKSIWWKWQAPTHGIYSFLADLSLVSDLVLSVYQGNSVDSLTLVAKGTTGVGFFGIGGQTYYVAAAVPENEVGDVILNLGHGAPYLPSIPVPGNLLREPSFEGTGLEVQYWGVSGGGGGYVNERGGADGTTWPTLAGGAKLWQDFPTVPGHRHQIRFAYANPGARMEVSWDNRVLGIAEIPTDEGSWHWPEFTAYASNTTSRVTFKNLGALLDEVQVDAFSVVDVSDPPVILTQPASVSTVAGGTAAFVVGVKGVPPFNCQWFLNDFPLAGQTNLVLALNNVAPEQAGNYRVKVMNDFGAVTSVVAVLTVDNPTNVTILFQPRGDAVAEGGYFNLVVVAAGTPPLSYHWFLNGVAVANATNRNYALTNAQPAHAGRYEVLVQNYSGSVWSLPANVVVTNGINGGGLIDFRNRSYSFVSSNNEAPVFDLDGTTRLNGSAYVAQLYAGPSLETMKPAGPPTPFRTGFDAGFFIPLIVTLPNVPPGGMAYTQVRVWEIGRGSSYEEARALGAKFGRSEVLQVVAGGGTMPPRPVLGLRSFTLQTGLPSFTVGVIEFVERQPDNVLVWSVRGEPGFRYVVEKALLSDEALWRPYAVLTNITGTVTFTDNANSGTGTAFYRARILD